LLDGSKNIFYYTSIAEGIKLFNHIITIVFRFAICRGEGLEISFPLGPMHHNIIATLTLSPASDFSVALRKSSNSPLNRVH